MTIMNGDVYRSGPWMQSLDYVGGGLPSYAIMRTEIRFAADRATFRELIEVDHRAEFEPAARDRVVTYEANSVYLNFTSDTCILHGHRPSPTTFVILSVTSVEPEATKQTPYRDNYLGRFDGYVFEKVCTDQPPSATKPTLP